MQHKPQISILMPVFNAEKFLDACIQSIVKQTFTNWELVIVNDHSTDASNDHIINWSAKDERIQIIQNKDKGIIPALALAFNYSNGAYITRMDADDIMPEDKLSLFAKQVQSHPNAVITGKVAYFSDLPISEGYKRYESWLNTLIDENNHWKYVYRECIIASPNWLIKRSFFERDFTFSDLTYPEDYDMVLKWYEKGYEIAAISEITHHWREHPARTSRNSENYQQKAFFKLKTERFINLEIEVPKNEKVQLIGAGIKGKLVAEQLEKHNIIYEWFDFKANQKDLSINGVAIQDLKNVRNDFKTILTVWPEEEQLRRQIRQFLSEKELVFGGNCWLF